MAQVQGKLRERETQDKNRNENIVSGHSDPRAVTALTRKNAARTLLGKEITKDTAEVRKIIRRFFSKGDRDEGV